MPFDTEGRPFGNWTGRGWAMEAYALAAMDFQLSQMYYGMQLAIALQRTLILPKARLCTGMLDAASEAPCAPQPSDVLRLATSDRLAMTAHAGTC